MINSFFNKSLVSVEGLTVNDIKLVFDKAMEMKKIVENKITDSRLKGKILAALFFEPSTRTFSSFISAIQRLGGGIIPLAGMSFTSIAKGETLPDTLRVYSKYSDVIVMRHPDPGSVKLASEFSQVPVINAGDGVNEHPTQALIDVFTIAQIFGKIDKLHILMIGDLAHYRPTNSLAKLLTIYKNVRLSFASPRQTPLPQNIRRYLLDKKMNFKEYDEFSGLLNDIDVLYVTRVKKEYMNEKLYSLVKGSYIVNDRIVNKMKKDSIIMHCLPRIDEIEKSVDEDLRSIYLTTQLDNSLYVRMALLDLILRK